MSCCHCRTVNSNERRWFKNDNNNSNPIFKHIHFNCDWQLNKLSLNLWYFYFLWKPKKYDVQNSSKTINNKKKRFKIKFSILLNEKKNNNMNKKNCLPTYHRCRWTEISVFFILKYFISWSKKLLKSIAFNNQQNISLIVA